MSVRALGVTIFGFGALISAVLGFSEHDAANKMPTYSDPVMESRFNELRNRPSNLMQPGDDPQIFLDYISAQQASNQLLSNAEKQMHLHAESRDEYIFLFLFCCAAVGFFVFHGKNGLRQTLRFQMKFIMSLIGSRKK